MLNHGKSFTFGTVYSIRNYSPSLLDKITDDDPPVAKYILTDVLTGDYCAMADCD